MNYDYNKRDYLLPRGCKDLLDVTKLHLKKKPTEEQAATQPIVINLSANVNVEAEMNRAKDLLRQGRKIRLLLRFRGRELANTAWGFKRMERSLTDLAGLGRSEVQPRLLGRDLYVVVVPFAHGNTHDDGA